MTQSAYANPDIHVLEQLIAVARRRWLSIVLFVIAGVVFGVLYAEMQPPQYASSSTVMVRSGFAADPIRLGIETSTPEEEGQFLSQLEYIKSSSVAAAVAAKLDLENDVAFAAEPLAGYKRLASVVEQKLKIRTGLVKTAEAKPLGRDGAISKLQAGVKALRAGRTYVAAISFQHANPEVAQKVAQAYAEAFRQKIAEATDMANSRARAAIEAELSKATPETRVSLEAKYQDMLISRALPGMDAVIISDAKKPGAPIAPRKPFLIAVGAILGAAIGCLFAGWREMRDGGLRDGDNLARRLGARFLGYLPRVSIDRTPGSTSNGGMTLPAGARLAVTEPYARFGESVRSAAIAAQEPAKAGQPVVIAVTSVLPGEGKTVFAANLAAHIGNQGRRVLLLDADLRRPELSDWLAPNAGQGALDVLLQGKPLSEAGLFEARSNLTFLPAALNGRSAEPAGLFSGAKMREFLAGIANEQDVVVIDLPSLTTAADARAMAPLVDSYILLAEWGGPSSELVETVLASEPRVAEKLAGIVVSKTEMKKLPLYVSAASRGAYQKRIG